MTHTHTHIYGVRVIKNEIQKHFLKNANHNDSHERFQLLSQLRRLQA